MRARLLILAILILFALALAPITQASPQYVAYLPHVAEGSSLNALDASGATYPLPTPVLIATPSPRPTWRPCQPPVPACAYGPWITPSPSP